MDVALFLMDKKNVNPVVVNSARRLANLVWLMCVDTGTAAVVVVAVAVAETKPLVFFEARSADRLDMLVSPPIARLRIAVVVAC